MPRRATVHRVRQVCFHCSRLHTAASRHGIYFHCQWCGGLNPGPEMVRALAMATPPARGRKVLKLEGPAPEPARRGWLEVLRGGRTA